MSDGAFFDLARTNRGVINANDNRTLLIQLYQEERDAWHKVWLLSFVIFHSILLVLIYLVLRLSGNKSLRRYMSAASSRTI